MPESFLEKIYYRMPTPLQNLAFSFYCLNIYRIRYSKFFRKNLVSLKKSEWWNEDRIKAFQDENVKKIVRHAYETVPFYRRWYDEHGIDVKGINTTDDIQKLPILTKEIVRANQHDMISQAFPKKSFVKELTSGTTGTPLRIFKTLQGIGLQWAIWWRHKARFGINVTDRYLTLGARVPVSQEQKTPPYWRNDYFNNRIYLSSYHISARNVRDIVQFLNTNHFDFYTGYPSAIYTLARLIDESHLKLFETPKHIVTGADALLPAYEATIRRVFRAPVTEQYGMCEFAGNISKCEHGVFHLDFECCHVETQPIEGNEYSRLIFTGWGNLAMPFIRYDVGDYGKQSSTYCACGRRSQCFETINGRMEDFIVTPDGRHLIGMNQVLEYAPNAKEIQIYQKTTDLIEFRVVATDQFGERDKKALIREFARRGGTGMSVSFKIVDTLEKSRSGKLKAVISELTDR